jgi:hypothetical protein
MQPTYEHTPTPWTRDRYGNVYSKGEQVLLTGFALNSGRHSELAEANAAHIVKCVNGYAELLKQRDELLSALLRMTERYVSLVECGDCGNWNPENEEAVTAAREAIAKVFK